MIPTEDVRLAVKRLRELMPSFRDPSHYANHEDIALVRRLEASLSPGLDWIEAGYPGYEQAAIPLEES